MLDSHYSLLQIAMSVTPKMVIRINNTQDYFLQLLDSEVEQHSCGVVPMVNEVDDVSPLNYERVVVW